MRRIVLTALTVISLVATASPATALAEDEPLCVRVLGIHVTCIW